MGRNPQGDLQERPADPEPRVGVGVIVFRGDRVLVGKRKGGLQAGKYCFPGGRLEHGESLGTCAIREVMEEAGIGIEGPRIVSIANNVMPDTGHHWLTVYFAAVAPATAEAVLREPDKNEGWEWVPIHKIPQPHMTPLENLRQLGFDGAPSDDRTGPVIIDFYRVNDGRQ